MVTILSKEKCSHCLKSISFGQKFFECYRCNCIIHEKCFGNSQADIINAHFYCSHCKLLTPKQYNPFKLIVSDNDDDTDFDPLIVKMSQILEKCKSYSTSEFNLAHSDDLKKYGGSLFLNIDGNKTNFDHLTTELAQLKHEFPIIALAETNICPEESTVYPLTNYNSFYQSTIKHKSKGTGVAIYIHQSLNAVLNPEFSTVTTNLESLFVTIHHESNPVHIGVIYRPPSGNQENSLVELTEIIEKLPKNNVHLMGDFNINMHNINSKFTQEFENTMLGTGFSPLISTSTHEKPGCKPSCIDNIFTNEIENTLCSGTLELNVSHHHAIFQINGSLNHAPKESQPKQTQHYDYCNSNVEAFLTSINDEFNDNPPENFNSFYNTFQEHLNKAFKLDKPKCSRRTALNNPWITGGLIASIKTKDTLYDKWKKAQKQECELKTVIEDRPNCDCLTCKNIVITYLKYKHYRKHLKHLIESAKKNHIGNKISECSGDSKKTWEIINRIRGKSRRDIKPSFILNDQRITNRRLIANEFNKYFTSIASKLNENHTDGIPLDGIPSFEEYLPNSCSSSIYLRDCTKYEIMDIINDLANGKSSDIPIHVIKKSAGIIAPHLEKYFNSCMQDGHFPDQLKLGRISPIYKKDNQELFENYRPISTLPVFGKILEKLICSRLYSFLSAKGIISENQFGFRKGHCTSHALNYSVSHIESLLKEKKHVLGIFIDLSKAFDTISHDKLLFKLNHYGIRGNALNLIKSYLSNRRQYVNVLNEDSSPLPVKWGVPQGSVLGPLLFLLYINDICNVSNNGKFILFADDTNVFVAADTRKQAYEEANNLLTSISRYMKSNLLHINTKKSCFMYFSPMKRENETSVNSELENLSLSIDGSIISRVRTAKFLGVLIDDKLSWKPHIEALNKRLRSACGRIYRIKTFLPQKLHKQIYHTLFESHLTFAISVWGGISNNTIEPIFITQKKCIRMIFGDNTMYQDKFKTCARARPIHCSIPTKHDHTVTHSTNTHIKPCKRCIEAKPKSNKNQPRPLRCQTLGPEFHAKQSTKPLFKLHELLTVHNLYKLRTITEIFKIIKYRLPIALYSLLTRSERRDNRLLTPKPSHNFLYKSSWLWNKFKDTNSKPDFTSTSCNSLKKCLKRSLQDAQNRYNEQWHKDNFDEFGPMT